MSPRLALLICICLILYLFWMDRKKTEGVSNGVWIPFIWMFLAGSRYVSLWLNLRTPDLYSDQILEGSPVDRAVFTLLIIIAILILRQRRVNWNALFTQNVWIWLYFVFGAVSFLWSDYPYISFKRWVKALGTVTMVVVVLTEERPYAAIGVILRRLAFLLLPLSVLFIKYYPELGRAYHMGRPMYTGVAFQKNSLGQICLLCGIYFLWNMLFNRSDVTASEKQLRYSIYFIMLPMIAWLFYMANSATSLACMISAICIFALARLPLMVNNPGRLLYFGIACLVFFALMELSFNVKDTIIIILGREPDLTGRTAMWSNFLSMVKHPIVGYGYESFWLSGRLQNNIDSITSVHNGYIEMYLNMGLFGLFFVVAWILSGLIKIMRYLEIDYPTAILRLSFIVVVSLYNWTEATLSGVSNMWMLLLFGVMETPGEKGPEPNVRNQIHLK
jgi:exopolysaccharide production protein ExoQ